METTHVAAQNLVALGQTGVSSDHNIILASNSYHSSTHQTPCKTKTKEEDIPAIHVIRLESVSVMFVNASYTPTPLHPIYQCAYISILKDFFPFKEMHEIPPIYVIPNRRSGWRF